jgi:hypothetical protein
MPKYLALIDVVATIADGAPTHPIVLPPPQPPGIWPSPGHPEHPIYNPPGIWPSPGYPAHPIVLPPNVIWPSPGYPAHPIAPGGPPPGIWPSPGVPTHPIVIPPDGTPPDLGIWGGANQPFPTPPIYIPGGVSDPVKVLAAVKAVYDKLCGNLPPPPSGPTPVSAAPTKS